MHTHPLMDADRWILSNVRWSSANNIHGSPTHKRSTNTSGPSFFGSRAIGWCDMPSVPHLIEHLPLSFLFFAFLFRSIKGNRIKERKEKIRFAAKTKDRYGFLVNQWTDFNWDDIPPALDDLFVSHKWRRLFYISSWSRTHSLCFSHFSIFFFICLFSCLAFMNLLDDHLRTSFDSDEQASGACKIIRVSLPSLTVLAWLSSPSFRLGAG